MTVYVVAHINIADRDRYADYEAGFMDVFKRFEGEVVAVDDDPEFLEGEGEAHRCVLIRFPNRDSLMAWYQSDDYQALAAARWDASTASITMVRGFG